MSWEMLGILLWDSYQSKQAMLQGYFKVVAPRMDKEWRKVETHLWRKNGQVFIIIIIIIIIITEEWTRGMSPDNTQV